MLAPENLRRRLVEAFCWHDDSADPSAWWRTPELLGALAGGLADLHRDARPTVVVGVESRGALLGPITALALGVRFVEVRKDFKADGEHGLGLLRRATPRITPDGR